MSAAKKICLAHEQHQSFDDIDEKKVDVINTLSLDSLATIFMLLPISERMNMEKVCFKWKEACQQAWYDITKYKCIRTIGCGYKCRLLTQSDVEKILLKCGIYLKELSLSIVCNSSIMPVVAKHCKNLTRLEIEYDDDSKINNANDYIEAFTQLDKLVFISIKVIINVSRKHPLTFPFEIINSLSEEINEIHFYFNIGPWIRKPLFFNLKKFKNLHSLTLKYCNLDNIFQQISDKKTLVYLDLKFSYLERESWVFNQLINLEHISISYDRYIEDSKYITPQVFSSILNTCKKLKYLNFNNRTCYNQKISIKNWKNLRNLEHLNAPCLITDESVMNIVKYCQNLKYLKIHQCNCKISELSFIKLTELKNLEHLKLNRIYKVSDKSIIAISKNCKKLKRLELPYCVIVKSIDNEPITYPLVLDELSKLQYLEHLNLSHIGDVYTKNKIQDSTIICIANNCKNLKHLNIESCKSITETALIALTSLKNLQELNVTCVDNVTDNFIIKLKGLKKFNCAVCDKLSTAGFRQFIKNCPELEELHLQSDTKTEIDTIIAADYETKERKNGIILGIYVVERNVINYFKKRIESQWLIIHSPKLSRRSRLG